MSVRSAAGLLRQAVVAKAREFARRDFARSVAVLASGTLVGNGLAALVSPILTRLYAPADMGRVGVYTSFINIASTAAALRYELAIVSASTADEAATLVLGSLGIAVPMSILLSGALYLLVTRGWLGFQVLPHWVVFLAPLSLFLASSFLVFRYWLIRDGRFGSVSRVFVGQNATRASVQIGSGFAHAGWIGLLASDFLGRTVAVVFFAIRGWNALVAHGRRVRAIDFRSAFAAHREFPTISLPSTLLDTLALYMPLPLVVHQFGIAAGGQFSLVQLVFALPLSLIGGSIGDAFHSRVAEYARLDRDRVRPFFARTTRLLFIAGLGPTVLLALAGPWLLPFVFGGPWRTAGLLAAVMTPWALGQLVVSPVSRVVFVVQGQRVKLVYDALNLCVVAAAFAIASRSQLTLLQTLGMLSVTQFVMYGVYYLLLLRAIARFIDLGLAAVGPTDAQSLQGSSATTDVTATPARADL